MKTYIKKLKCLGDENRIRILNTMIKANDKLCVCEIVDALNIPFYTISKHLKELKNADIIDESREGKFVFYQIKESEKPFDKNIIEIIKSIPESYLINDNILLQKRLNMREDGKCVIGITDKNQCSCKES